MSTISAIAPSPKVEVALRQASAKTGVDFDYLLRTAKRESAFKPSIKSNSSSATGLFQFIEQTWLSMVKKAGAAAGIGNFAKAIETNSSGRHNVADQRTKSAILALRKNPKMAAFMAGVFTQENAQELNRDLGRPAKQGELYIAHFLGVKSASKLISTAQQSPNTKAADLFPAAARANKSIFYDRSGHARSVASVYRNLTASFGTEPTAIAKANPSAAARQEIARTDLLFVPNTRKPGQPLNIIPAGLMAHNRGGLFSNLYSPNPSATAPARLTSDHFHLFESASPTKAKVQPVQTAKLEAKSDVQFPRGTKPLLHNLFSTGATRPLVS